MNPMPLMFAVFIASAPFASVNTTAAARQVSAKPEAPGSETPVATEEAEHEAIRQMRAAYETAVRENKLDGLAPLLSKDFHGVMVTGQDVNSLADLQQYWANIRNLMGAGGSYTTTLNPERSVILGDMALARGTSDDRVVTGGGVEYLFNMHWTAVLQKEDGRWRLRQAHGSIDPVNNSFVRNFTQRAVVLAAVVSGVVGLILGGGAAMVLFKRRQRAVA